MRVSSPVFTYRRGKWCSRSPTVRSPSLSSMLSRFFLWSPRTATTDESRPITGLPPFFWPSLDGHEERVPLLASVVHHDVDSRVVLLDVPRAPGGQRPLGVLGSRNDRHQL